MEDIYVVEGLEPEFVEEVFNYLDFLRETGLTNMFGARPFIEDEFDVDKAQARKLLSKWMETFKARKEAKDEEHA